MNNKKKDIAQEKSTNDSSKRNNGTNVRFFCENTKKDTQVTDNKNFNDKTVKETSKTSAKYKSSKTENNVEYEILCKEFKSAESIFSNKLEEKNFMMTVLNRNSCENLFPKYSFDGQNASQVKKSNRIKNTMKDKDSQRNIFNLANSNEIVDKNLIYMKSDKLNTSRESSINSIRKSIVNFKHKKASDSLNIIKNNTSNKINIFGTTNFEQSPSYKEKKPGNPNLKLLVSSKSNDALNHKVYKLYKEATKKLSNSNDFKNGSQNNTLGKAGKQYLSTEKLKNKTPNKHDFESPKKAGTFMDFAGESVLSMEALDQKNSNLGEATPKSLNKMNSEARPSRFTKRENSDSLREFTEIEDEILSQHHSIKDS